MSVDPEKVMLMAKLPWRGPAQPLRPEVPEECQPQLRGVPRVRQFLIKDDTQRREYEAVLSRIEQGLAAVVDSQIAEHNGSWIVLLHWHELYMSGPHFQAPEAGPDIGTDYTGALVPRSAADAAEKAKLEQEVTIDINGKEVISTLEGVVDMLRKQNSKPADLDIAEAIREAVGAEAGKVQEASEPKSVVAFTDFGADGEPVDD